MKKKEKKRKLQVDQFYTIEKKFWYFFHQLFILIIFCVFFFKWARDFPLCTKFTHKYLRFTLILTVFYSNILLIYSNTLSNLLHSVFTLFTSLVLFIFIFISNWLVFTLDRKSLYFFLSLNMYGSEYVSSSITDIHFVWWARSVGLCVENIERIKFDT